jgi:hypothetical protein
MKVIVVGKFGYEQSVLPTGHARFGSVCTGPPLGDVTDPDSGKSSLISAFVASDS